MKDFKLNKKSLGALYSNLSALTAESDKSYRVSVKEWRDSRSVSQNALQHKWYKEISEFMISKGREFSAEAAKDSMKHTFLGYTQKVMVDVTTGERTEISELRGTKALDKGEAKYYMDLIYSFWIDKGLFLTIPENSIYKGLGDGCE